MGRAQPEDGATSSASDLGAPHRTPRGVGLKNDGASTLHSLDGIQAGAVASNFMKMVSSGAGGK